MPSEHNSDAVTSDLPELLKKIEDNWPILPSGLWNSSSIQKLSRLLHELSIRSKSEDAPELHQIIVAIDTEISQIIDDNTPPGDTQMESLAHNLEKLRAVAGAPRVNKPKQTPAKVSAVGKPSPFDVLILLSSKSEAEPLFDSLGASGLRGKIVSDPEELQISLAGPGTKTLLVDASFLGDQALEPALHLSRGNLATAPKLFVISDQSTIDTRLAAMRAGALQLFTKPIEPEHLVETLNQHLHPKPTARHRVLIVEDDESQAKFASKLLEKGGLEVLAITDPLRVIEAVCRFQPDLILMDLYMPGADGIELTRMIRSRWQSAAIPVAFLSGEDNPEKKLLALQAGADDFLTKPVRPQQLLATVKTRISRAQQITEVVHQQVTQSKQMATRRELLNTLDMAMADESPVHGFRALLVIRFGTESSLESLQQTPDSKTIFASAIEVIRPVMQEGDILAGLEYQGMALLCQRSDELALESLAERLYEGVSKSLATSALGHIGLGVVLLNSEPRQAYELLSKGEACAHSAYERKQVGYQLYGEETPVTSGTQAEQAGTDTACDLLRSALGEGSLPASQQIYSSQKEQPVHTVELLPRLPHTASPVDIYDLAQTCNLGTGLDRLVYQHALLELGKQIAQGKGGRILFRQSKNLVTEADTLDFLKTQLRRCQIVGTGLMMEFDLPSLSAKLKQSRELIGELGAMGIGVALGNFACNTTAFKVLSYLRADAIRPHPSLLQINAERVALISQQARALRAEIILPRVSSHGEIGLPWSEYADYIQADFGS